MSGWVWHTFLRFKLSRILELFVLLYLSVCFGHSSRHMAGKGYPRPQPRWHNLDEAEPTRMKVETYPMVSL